MGPHAFAGAKAPLSGLLSQGENILAALLESASQAIIGVDIQGRIVLVNSRTEEMFGYSRQELIGASIELLVPEVVRKAHAGHREDFFARPRVRLAGLGMDLAAGRKDGTEFPVEISLSHVKTAEGIFAIAFVTDISQRKKLEDQLLHAQKMEAVGRLAAGVAHDFNNLLTVIMGYVEMLMVEAEGQPDLVDYAQEIQYAANRASALTAQLLAFSRRQVSQPKVIDLNEVVTHSTKLLRRVIGEDIEIATHLDADLGKVKADPIHIDQVIMNLVVNARDAMGGGGKLTLETANTVLDDDYVGRHIGVKAGPYAMLAISDTGSGMSPEVRDRIFEPFFTTKEAGKGTGLGLSIVYGIVKQNHGEVMVYSEVGKGTTFKIYLPLVEVAAEAASQEAGPTELRGSETILLCEDEAGIRKLVRTMLDKQGYQVLEASSPQEAMQIAAAKNGAIHLLLTDVVMPQMSGFDLARAVRERRPGVKVLYMSGYTDNRVSSSWELAPDTPFLHKPFTAVNLAQKIREALANGVTSAG